MTDLDALLAGIVAHPHEAVRWLIVADWLDDHGFADRAELLRLHRMLIDTCCEPDAHPERAAWQARIVELIDQGVKPCVPQHTLMLPGGVPLVGNFIPPGSFLMGSEEDEGEQPVHKVTITKGFFLGIHPVTQAQWKAVMETNPSHFRGDEWRALMGIDPSNFSGNELPVESVCWDDATKFCKTATEATRQAVRLPTEAEWEYSCRAGSTTHFHFGDAPSDTRMNYAADLHTLTSDAGFWRQITTPVGTFPPNPWGLFDSHGNVEEWCIDCWEKDFYDRTSLVDPANLTCEIVDLRVLRGGSWYMDDNGSRAAARSVAITSFTDKKAGFRVAFTLT